MNESSSGIRRREAEIVNPEAMIGEYPIENCKAAVKVILFNDPKDFVPHYHISYPEVGSGTRITLDEIKIEILSRSKIPVEKMVDQKFIESVRKDFSFFAHELLAKRLFGSEKKNIEVLVEILINEMLGLADLEYVLLDDNIEEIVLNSAIEPAWIYHKKYGWMKTNLWFDSEKEIENFASIIARRSGKQITVLTPLLDAHLSSGDRANATLNPVSSHGNTITIRRFRRNPWTVTELISNGSASSESMAIIWMAMHYELNVIFSGGTASGKTSLLNACLSLIPPTQRVISIEDTRELTLPKFLHWVPMVSRPANTEGKGEISMLDLLVNSLRMRPDRIVVGEVRRQKEAEVMFEAMNTGHSVYATFHADTAEETIRRFANPPLDIPQGMLASIGLNITLFRNSKTSQRSIYQISEIVVEDRGIEQSAKANVLFRYISTKGIIKKQHDSVRFYDLISVHTGMGAGEIDSELKQKEKILDWLVKNNIFRLDDLGMIFAKYYQSPDLVYEFSQKGKDPRLLFE